MNLVRIGQIYIVLITIAWCVLFYMYLHVKDIQKKNKNHYKLEEISFVLVPEDNDTVLMNFLYGNKVVRSTRFTDADLFNDRNAPFKEFIKWCEEDYKG